VLAHGLFGFSRIGLGPLTLASYFKDVPEFLRASGNRVLVPTVQPIAGVSTRAERLGEQIRATFPDQPVHLICHSMGGLDARALLAEPDWARRVLTLTTIGTPHLGSSMADFAQLHAGGIYRMLQSLGIDHQGLLDLTCKAARAFNAATPPPEHIPCFSVAGNPLPDDVFWPLQRYHATLFEMEGPNDSMVSVESANAFGTPLEAWPVDHLHQVHWLAPVPSHPIRPPLLGLYANLVDHLAKLGFGAPIDPLHDDHSQDLAPGAIPIDKAGRSWFGFVGSPIEQNGNGHVAQDVGGGAAAIEEPVNGQEHGQ
jgi:triacylglycerol lipase